MVDVLPHHLQSVPEMGSSRVCRKEPSDFQGGQTALTKGDQGTEMVFRAKTNPDFRESVEF